MLETLKIERLFDVRIIEDDVIILSYMFILKILLVWGFNTVTMDNVNALYIYIYISFDKSPQ
jgi:hypothetical protein